MMEKVILVDERDNELGLMDKMEAHRAGILHRAFSVLLFNSKGEVLLQKRAADKYHSAGLWSNTCCSHPKPNEQMDAAVRRRLMEEMGVDVQPEFAYKFLYKVSLDNNLIEHELDHVYIGQFDGDPAINTAEVAGWKFERLALIKEDIMKNPGAYTHWFKLMLHHSELEVSIPN